MADYNLEYGIRDVNDSDEDRNLNNYVDSIATERNVYITSRNMNGPENRILSYTGFHFAFFLFHRTRPDIDPLSDARIHSSYLSFSATDPLERFASAHEAKALVTRMLVSDHQFPFYVIDRESGQRLLWKELPADGNGSSSSAVEPVQLEDLDDMITKISEAVARIAREASESGRHSAQIIVKIDKCTVVPHQEFGRVFLLNHHNYDDNILVDDDDDEDEPELNIAIEESFVESATAFGSLPAAKSVVEALEMFKYEGICDQDHKDESKLRETCVICMEEVMIGSQLTRMPCSHHFHRDCIARWLHMNHTCPLCRFELPSQ
ncbi:hypothetical protein TIFTF001_003713 [Ficus carica]|uniref:RING-type E3 ubiquitin transferase n=1 Tax=Ficus carica TaxID=3494 RepID=A0AA88CRY5_FICCA|nr:hypothetical protein TIFTF001_003713 [Ficus carica]